MTAQTTGGSTASRFLVPFGLTALVSVVLLVTRVPSLYTLDSAEFVTSAYTLGIAHSPGYPLYTVLLHGFMRLVTPPDVAGNLFSALTLALSVPFAYSTLSRWLEDDWAAASAVLLAYFSYYIWVIGLFAEVYAPQILTLAIALWALTQVAVTDGRTRAAWALGVGAAFGIAVAMHPVSALFAPGVALSLRGQGVSWARCIAAGALALVIALAPLLYFPIRYAQIDTLAINLAGTYDAQGIFQPVPLDTLGGILWMLSGRQFDWLFFAGARSLTDSLAQTAGWFFGAFLGIGVVLGVIGIARLRHFPRLLVGWLALFLPYTLFFALYGAPDRALMMGPAYLLWGLPLSYGLVWLVGVLGGWRGRAALLLLPLVMLFVHFPLLNLSQNTSVRLRAQAALDALPQDATLFGAWTGITPVEYLHIVEGQRPDLRLYNLFLFQPDALPEFVTMLTEADAAVYFLDSDGIGFVNLDDAAWDGVRVTNFHTQTFQDDEPPLVIYQILPQ